MIDEPGRWLHANLPTSLTMIQLGVDDPTNDFLRRLPDIFHRLLLMNFPLAVSTVVLVTIALRAPSWHVCASLRHARHDALPAYAF